jgi:hypothetical protein
LEAADLWRNDIYYKCSTITSKILWNVLIAQKQLITPKQRGGEQRSTPLRPPRGRSAAASPAPPPPEQGPIKGKEFQFKTFWWQSLLHSVIFVSDNKAFVQ